MRHRVAHRKLGRVTEHRIAMLRNQATALLRYEHLTTTVPRAKELRPFVERIITIAKRSAGGRRERQGAPCAPAGHARPPGSRGRDQAVRHARPAVRGRPGGYTRLLRLGFRKGDAAEIAQVELVGSEFNPRAKAEAEAKGEGAAPKKAKGVGGRLRAAAERLRRVRRTRPSRQRSRPSERARKAPAAPSRARRSKGRGEAKNLQSTIWLNRGFIGRSRQTDRQIVDLQIVDRQIR